MIWNLKCALFCIDAPHPVFVSHQNKAKVIQKEQLNNTSNRMHVKWANTYTRCRRGKSGAKHEP